MGEMGGFKNLINKIKIQVKYISIYRIHYDTELKTIKNGILPIRILH